MARGTQGAGEATVKTAVKNSRVKLHEAKVATTECNLAGKMSVLFCYMTLTFLGTHGPRPQ